MATLYVIEPGARIEKEYRRILVTKGDEVLAAVPLRHISEVVLVGWAGATTPAMLALLDNNISLTLVNRTGKLRGRLRPADERNIALRRAQYLRLDDPDFRCGITRAIVRGKLSNCRTFARRILRRPAIRQQEEYPTYCAQFERLVKSLKKVDQTEDADALRGLEGAGTRAYFAILRAGLDWEGQGFAKRTRRPPKDPVNALFSLGYTLLTGALVTACEVAGLDPYAGFFHSQKYGRPALALDLVEEFRPVIVDSIVLKVLNKRMLKTKDFRYEDGGGVFLQHGGLRVFLREFSLRLGVKIYHPLVGRSLSYQKCFEIQARRMRKVIEGELDTYVPMRVK